jgi:hypothetical protein
VLLLSLFGQRALAQHTERADKSPASTRDKLIVKAMLELGGKVSVNATSTDLDPTLGAGLDYEHPLHPFFVLGGHLGVASWITTNANTLGAGHNTMVDLSVVPKLRFAANEDVELYVSLPLGATLDSAANDAFGGTLDTALGWNFAALFGGQIGFTDSVGLMGEMGYALHSFTHSITLPLAVGTVDFDMSLAQFVVTLGLYAKL